MNIFVLDRSPKLCAEYSANHTLKIGIDNACVLLAQAQFDLDSIYVPGIPRIKIIDQPSPWVSWVRAYEGNYLWMRSLLIEYATESLERFRATYALENVNAVLSMQVPKRCRQGALTPFPYAMPYHFLRSDEVESYRLFYIATQVSRAFWTRRNPPPWWQAMQLSHRSALEESKIYQHRTKE